MTYRVQFAPQTDAARKAMEAEFQTRFDSEIQRTLGQDPYGHGSSAIDGYQDRREAAAGGTIVVYYVAKEALVVTAVQVLY